MSMSQFSSLSRLFCKAVRVLWYFIKYSPSLLPISVQYLSDSKKQFVLIDVFLNLLLNNPGYNVLL